MSLSNTLFRRDAGGEFAAYLVDAETGELHETLSDGQREHDLEIARVNLFGEFSDLEAGGMLDTALDPATLVETIETRYQELWSELTEPEEFDDSQLSRIEGRVRRLNALGFDVAELDITTDIDGTTIRIQPKVVDAGHHSRRLLRLTGLDTEENQARRLLNDLDTYSARTGQQNMDEAVVAHQWLTHSFEPVIERSRRVCAANWNRPRCSTRCWSTAGTARRRPVGRSPPWSRRPTCTSTTCCTTCPTRRCPRRTSS